MISGTLLNQLTLFLLRPIEFICVFKGFVAFFLQRQMKLLFEVATRLVLRLDEQLLLRSDENRNFSMIGQTFSRNVKVETSSYIGKYPYSHIMLPVFCGVCLCHVNELSVFLILSVKK